MNLESEPGIIALGSQYLATSMNNNVWYYAWNNKDVTGLSKLIHKRDYFFSVKYILLNSKWSALYTEGKCVVHPITAGDN